MDKKALSSTIKLLGVLDKNWPKGVMLFANNGMLELVDSRSFRIIERFASISCDGGDPGVLAEDDGDEYLNIGREGER